MQRKEEKNLLKTFHPFWGRTQSTWEAIDWSNLCFTIHYNYERHNLPSLCIISHKISSPCRLTSIPATTIFHFIETLSDSLKIKLKRTIILVLVVFKIKMYKHWRLAEYNNRFPPMELIRNSKDNRSLKLDINNFRFSLRFWRKAMWFLQLLEISLIYLWMSGN